MFYVQNSGCFMQKIPFKGDAHKRKWVVIIFKICNYMAFKKKRQLDAQVYLKIHDRLQDLKNQLIRLQYVRDNEFTLVLLTLADDI